MVIVIVFGDDNMLLNGEVQDCTQGYDAMW